jgi:hypothetical protein
MPSVIPNSTYIIMVSDRNCLKYVCVFCTVIIMCTELFDHPVFIYKHVSTSAVDDYAAFGLSIIRQYCAMLLEELAGTTGSMSACNSRL